MFTIDINFLRDRQAAEGAGEAQPIADVQWLIGGGAVAAVLIFGSLGAYFYFSNQEQRLQAQVQQLVAQEAELDRRLAELQAQEAQIVTIDQQTQQLLALFVGEVPSSALLQDIRERTPNTIRIESVAQIDRRVTLQGQAAAPDEQASAFDQINDFMLKLQESPFLAEDGVQLRSARLAPPQRDVPVDVAQYQLELTLTPQTALELEEALQQVQSEGIISRIAVLRQAGIQVGTQQPQGEQGQ